MMIFTMFSRVTRFVTERRHYLPFNRAFFFMNFVFENVFFPKHVCHKNLEFAIQVKQLVFKSCSTQYDLANLTLLVYEHNRKIV